MGAVKDLTEAGEIKKRWQKYKNTKKVLMTRINMKVCVVTHLEPDTLKCEVKGALGSITTSKTSGGGGIPSELIKIPR